MKSGGGGIDTWFWLELVLVRIGFPQCQVHQEIDFANILYLTSQSGTYDHRKLKFRHPVRSALYKQFIGGLVVRWVTTGESPLSYVILFLHLFFFVQLSQVTCV